MLWIRVEAKDVLEQDLLRDASIFAELREGVKRSIAYYTMLAISTSVVVPVIALA